MKINGNKKAPVTGGLKGYRGSEAITNATK
jgi:hypothetical protein